MAKKVIILLLLAVAAIGVIMYSQITGPAGEEITPKAATGDIDDAVNALLAEIDDEQLTLDGITDDESLLFSDSQEVNSFNQSVDENEF